MRVERKQTNGTNRSKCHHACDDFSENIYGSIVILTILCIEQHLIEMGLIVIKGLSDVVYSLLISQVTIHETAK